MFEMANIGKTKNGGVSRLALTEIDKQGRNVLIEWMQEIGLEVRYDDFGNIYGRMEGTHPDGPVVMSGSHLDSVPMGGKFDGSLGVLAALEVIETMKENNIKPYYPIEVVSFTNEEGVRFNPQMLGSGAVTNEFSREYVYNREDDQGLKFKDELRKIGFMGEEKNRLKKVRSFIEMHIEQGPILERNKQTIGIVNGIAGFTWLEVTINGESNHSGTTPMEYRKDSLVIAANVIKKINHWAKTNSNGVLATVGKIETQPGVINAVPGKTTFTLDVRCTNTSEFQSILDEMKGLISNYIGSNGFTYEIKEIKTHPPVSFSPNITNVMEKACKNRNVSYQLMHSGAAHDAMYMNNITETGMLFIPSINGVSHSEEEKSHWDDIEKGVSVLYETLVNLAKQEQNE